MRSVCAGGLRDRQSARTPCVKSLSRVLFAAYTITLAWLILFKFSVHIIVRAALRQEKLELGRSQPSGSSSQAVDNVLVFIPFGLLMSVNFKHLNFWSKLLVVFGASIGG